ncbi:MAG TPA: LysR substrate-binding domain-containing protein [Steroidobacter sp.]|uniref:LysR substrate-binding domain-containing protein n=1 Tax=Steroidobacter sp. TaxID=1978227 RepID=UPI002ED9055C
MDVRQLRYFVRIVEAGSFTKAAEQLHIAQPALSFAMRKLEEELGQQLLLRHSRGVEPTAAGAILVQGANEVLDKVAETVRKLRSCAQGLHGELTVGIPPSVSDWLATELVRRCTRELPHVHVGLVEDLSPVLIEWVELGRLDMTLAFQPSETRGLMVEPLLTEDLYFVTSGSAPEGDCISVAEVTQYPLAMVSAANGVIRRKVCEAAKAQGIKVNIAFEMQSLAIVRRLVEQSLASSILPFGVASRLARGGSITARRIVAPTISVTTALVSSADRPFSAPLGAVQEIIRTLLSERSEPVMASAIGASRYSVESLAAASTIKRMFA